MDGQATNKTGGAYDHLSTVADRRDLSRIEVVTGGQALFEGGSTTVATGGQIAVSAGRQALLQSGAALDVAGAIGVKVAMESNSVRIDVQGNEQRDSPVNRDSKNLNNSEVWVDRRTLVKVAAGVNGYQNERWYTAGAAGGGRLSGDQRARRRRVAGAGRHGDVHGRRAGHAGRLDINLSGGTLDVRDGISARAGCAARTAACTSCRARQAICSTPACTRASSRSMSVGASGPRAPSTTR